MQQEKHTCAARKNVREYMSEILENKGSQALHEPIFHFYLSIANVMHSVKNCFKRGYL